MPFRAQGGPGAWLAALALSASCSLIDSARDKGTGGADGAAVGDDTGLPAPDVAEPPQPCESGETLAPVAAFNASPTDPANACSIDNVLVRDDNVAGLDLAGLTDDGCDRLSDDDIGGCGCVGVDFGRAQPLTAILVRAAPTGDACGQACDPGDCGTGHSFVAWYGVESGSYTLIDNPDLVSDQLVDYELDIGQDVRYVIVCREWWGAMRDDVAVDSVEGICSG